MLLYLHIPFCDSKCHYCAFNSYTHLHGLIRDYMTAICLQFDAEIERFGLHEKIFETLFIGGGTPSCVAPELYDNFFERIKPFLSNDAEITAEANPNSATPKWLEGMRQRGVNRISFGVQSFDEKKLHFLNRAHTPRQGVDALNNASKIGFENLSLDLIYGTSEDSRSLLKYDLDQAFSLPITHLSAYHLTIEENTPFYTTPQVRIENDELSYWFVQEITQRGLPQYEISNFSHTPSKHNLGYWEYKDYLGIGAGSVGFLKDRRFYTHNEPATYIKQPIFREEELLTSQNVKEEKVLLGLRSSVGFDLSLLNDQEKQRIQTLIDAKKLHIQNERIYNPNFFLADEIALYTIL